MSEDVFCGGSGFIKEGEIWQWDMSLYVLRGRLPFDVMIVLLESVLMHQVGVMADWTTA